MPWSISARGEQKSKEPAVIRELVDEVGVIIAICGGNNYCWGKDFRASQRKTACFHFHQLGGILPAVQRLYFLHRYFIRSLFKPNSSAALILIPSARANARRTNSYSYRATSRSK